MGPAGPSGGVPLACNKFAATQTLAAIGYVLAPTAPPQMVTGLRRPPRPGDYGLGRIVQSPHGAMPSAHTAFSLVAAGTFWAPAPSRPVRAAALLFPPAVGLEIIATGDTSGWTPPAGIVVASLGYAIDAVSAS